MNTPTSLVKLQLFDVSEQGFHVNLTRLKSQEDFDSINSFLSVPPPELQTSFQNWYESYCQLDSVRQMRITPKSVAVPGSCVEYRDAVKTHLNQWLNNNDNPWQFFREELIYLFSQLKNSGEEIGIVLDVDNIQLSHFPWQEWQLLESRFPNTEVAIRVKGLGQIKPPFKSKKVKILMVIGTREGLNTDQDLQAIQKLEDQGAEVKVLIEPNKQELSDACLKENRYHIFIFSGHSGSNAEGKIGWIQINNSPEGRLSINEFRNNFRVLIDQGLQLAIFNSCDGLGLAHQLAKINLPRSIVMREPVPDHIAIRFLQYFFDEFTQNKSLFSCVNRAKKSLEFFDDQKCPGAMWLPTLCVRESALSKPLTWQQLIKSKPKFDFKSIKKPVLIGAIGAIGAALLAIGLWITSQKTSQPERTEPEVTPPQAVTEPLETPCPQSIASVQMKVKS